MAKLVIGHSQVKYFHNYMPDDVTVICRSGYKVEDLFIDEDILCSLYDVDVSIYTNIKVKCQENIILQKGI